MAAGDASAIALAINNAINGNQADGDGGADMSATAVATVSGNVVTLKVTDGTKVEILRDGTTLSPVPARSQLILSRQAAPQRPLLMPISARVMSL